MRIAPFSPILFCALALCLSPCRAEEAEAWTGKNVSLPEAAALKNATLSQEAKEVKNWVFTRGSATYTLNGQAAYLKAGTTTCGIYFKGQGRFKYTTKNKMEFPVTTFNAARHVKSKLESSADAISVAEGVEEATFWFADASLIEIPGAPGTLASSDFDAQQKFFRSPSSNAFFHKLALCQLDPMRKPYFVAELRSKVQPWLHEVDEMEAESLVALSSHLHDDGSRFEGALISKQPIGWDIRAPRAPRFTLTRVDLNLEAYEGMHARLRVQETLVPNVEGLKVLELNLRSNRMGINALGGKKLQKIEIHSITDAKGKSLPFDHQDWSLIIPIEGLKAGVPVVLNFDIEGAVLNKSVDNCWSLRPGPWFPLPESLAAQMYTVHATVKVPKPFIPFMGGDTIRRVSEGDLNILETRIDKPIQFFSIAAGKYEIKEETKNGVTVRIAGYSGLGSGGPKLLSTVTGIVGYYDGLLGPFPFKELNIVEVPNELGHGQAPPGMVFITGEAFRPIDNTRNRAYAAAWINQGMAHEVAHQYWGHLVKMWSPEDQWITESFAEYTSGFAYMNMKGKDRYEVLVDCWYEDAGKAKDAAPIALANNLAPDREKWTEWSFRQDLVYFKGALLLHQIHKELGDDMFVRFLRVYLKSLAWQPSTTAHIPMILKALTGKDYTPFLEANFWGMGLPPRKP